MAHEDEGQIVWHIDRQADGWPMGIDREGKQAMTRIVEGVIREARVPLTLDGIYHSIRVAESLEMVRTPRAYREARLWSWIYCCLERAVRAAGAERVYVIRKEA